MKYLLARLGYGLAFCGVLPLLMVLLSHRLDAWLRIAVPGSPALGWMLLGIGIALMLASMGMLWRKGGGLPMNAFPPTRLVATGLYAWLPHPIYVGFVVTWAGGALIAQSPAAFWILTPIAALGCMSLVWGYERIDLLARFGALSRPWLALPPDDDARPSASEAAAVAVLVLGSWLLAYEGVLALGHPRDAFPLFLPGEAAFPVWAWTEPLYASAYLGIPLALFLSPSRMALRRFGVQGSLAIVGVSLIYLVLPITALPRTHEATGWLGWMLDLERRMSVPPTASFPSFHALWALLVADLLSGRGRGWRVIAWIWALGVVAACWTTGMHTLADLVAAVAVFALLYRPRATYGWLLGMAERLAAYSGDGDRPFRPHRDHPVRAIAITSSVTAGAV